VRRWVAAALSLFLRGHDDCFGSAATAVQVVEMMGRSGAGSGVRDPRFYQIVALSTLLALGLLRFGFDIPLSHVGITLTSALAGQWLAAGMGRPSTPAANTSPPPFEWRSALISGISLCLLLRTREPVWMAVAGLIAVGSKFVLRVPRVDGRGTKHLLNPTNGAIVLLLLAHAPVWVSPAQWGHHLILAFGVAGFGSLVVHRSARSDVTLAFLAAWAALLFGRAAWLGQAWAAPLHQLETGSLALFAFHMISDPKTTPDSRAGRIVFACLVALGAGLVQFVLYRTNGLLWSLAACSLFVPILDRWLPGRGFEWSAPGTGAFPSEVRHAQSGIRIPAGAAGGVRTA
jgi:Na+-translocating ferredoxin:NAD+ oxidoreductase RnfD subunit